VEAPHWAVSTGSVQPSVRWGEVACRPHLHTPSGNKKTRLCPAACTRHEAPGDLNVDRDPFRIHSMPKSQQCREYCSRLGLELMAWHLVSVATSRFQNAVPGAKEIR